MDAFRKGREIVGQEVSVCWRGQKMERSPAVKASMASRAKERHLRLPTPYITYQLRPARSLAADAFESLDDFRYG